MFVSLLGPLELRTAGGAETPRGPKVRQILALLAMRAGHTVALDSFVAELWDGEPPRSGLTTLRTHLYHLRTALAAEDSRSPGAGSSRSTAGSAGPGSAGPGSGSGRSGGIDRELLVTRPSGYLLRLTDDDVDVRRFLRLAEQGRARFRAGHAGEAAETLAAALALWQGHCLQDVVQGRLLAAHAARLEELRLCALELRIEADLRLGRHHELVPELRHLTASHPLHEWFHARLMVALHRSGRRGEALHAFRALRGVLDEELGLEPSAELQRLHAAVLAGREDAGCEDAGRDGAAPARAAS